MIVEECMHRRKCGFSLVELLVVVAIVAVVLAAALPLMRNARLNAVETIVAREMQTIATAQTQYQSQFGKYAATLGDLGPPNRGIAEGPQAARLIPASLASGEKDGYVFLLSATPAGYFVNANPKVFGNSGRRTFYVDQDGVLHQNWGPDPATVDSPEFK